MAASTGAVFDQQSGAQIWRRAQIVSIALRQVAKLMQHPKESGAQIVDHIVYEPTEVALSLFVGGADFVDAYEDVRRYYTAAKPVQIQSRVQYFENMVITTMPHREDADIVGAAVLELVLREVVIVSAQYGKSTPRKPDKQAPVDVGNVKPGSAAADLVGKVRNALK